MPIFMDVHFVPGVKARAVAEAHRMDVLIQNEHACKCITYWIDEARENIFCLIEAPTREAVNELHGRSHGLIPNRIIEVNSNLVGSFLGRLFDPADAEITDDGLKVFEDPSFRVLLVIRISDPVLLKHRFGREKADELLTQIYSTLRKNIAARDGREVEEKGPGFISSFRSASKAVSCAIAVQNELSEFGLDPEDLRIAVNGGEPVGKSDSLFGETIQFAGHMCEIKSPLPIVVSPEVSELISKDLSPERRPKIKVLIPQDQAVLTMLYQNLEENWRDPDFDVSRLGDAMMMSKSQLYRKVLGVAGVSPVALLKDFRLARAKDIMRKKRESISEIAFASGFTSPSYFTKCFKKKYGLLPMAYIDLL